MPPIPPIFLSPTFISSIKFTNTFLLNFRKISSISFATALTRSAWKSLPQWIRDDQSLRVFGKYNNDDDFEDDDDGEMASLSACINKLQALISTSSTKLETPLKQNQIHAAILAYIQLMRQFQVLLLQEESNQLNLETNDPRLSKAAHYSDIEDNLISNKSNEISETYNHKHELGNMKEALEFAIWSYDEDEEILRKKLEDLDFFLLIHTMITKPGHVGHFVAISPEQKRMIIGIKGTTSFGEVITDCCGQAVAHILSPSPFTTNRKNNPYKENHTSKLVIEEDSVEVRCHEGILICAKRVAQNVKPFVEQLCISSNYKITVSGHSLGAGVASLLAILLRSQYSKLMSNDFIHVYAFAPPPIIDMQSSKLCINYTTTIVNHSDIVPRMNMTNVRALLRMLRLIHEKLEDRGMSFGKGPRSALALIRKLNQGSKVDDLLMSHEEYISCFSKIHQQISVDDSDFLFVPGRLFIMYDNTVKSEDESNYDENNLSATGMYSSEVDTSLNLMNIDIFRTFIDHSTYSYTDTLDLLIQQEE